MSELWKVRCVRKGGRLASGREGDMGKIQHLIVGGHPGDRPNPGTHWPARCGATPADGGVGWVEVEEIHRSVLTRCYRCFREMEFPEPPNPPEIPAACRCGSCGGEARIVRVRPVPTQLRVECRECKRATPSVNDRPGAEAERLETWNRDMRGEQPT